MAIGKTWQLAITVAETHDLWRSGLNSNLAHGTPVCVCFIIVHIQLAIEQSINCRLHVSVVFLSPNGKPILF